jgi:hypothetical protein
MGDELESIQARLSGLPRTSEWVAGIVSTPAYVTSEAESFRPAAVLWFETGSGLIVASELVHPREALDRAVALFLEATVAPLAGNPRVPRRVRVATRELFDALDGKLGGVPLVHSATPELDSVAEAMAAHMLEAGEEDEENDTYLGPGIAADDMGQMFRAAARLYRLQPWRVFPSDEFISVSCEAIGIDDGALCVVGQMGQSFGFVLFRSLADASLYGEAIDDVEAGRRPTFPQHVMFSYDDEQTVGRVLAGEVRTHGWELAGPDAYPTAIVVDPDMATRFLARGELAAVTAIIEAMADLIVEDPDLADAWEGGAPRRRTAEVETEAGAIAVEIEAPLRPPRDEGGRSGNGRNGSSSAERRAANKNRRKAARTARKKTRRR